MNPPPGHSWAAITSGRGTTRSENGQGGRGGQGNWYGVGYDAVHSKGRRAMPQGRVLSEDLELRDLARRQLTTGIRDLNRNFAIAGWMVRRHLDYVASFRFRAKTGIKAIDDQLEAFVSWWSKPENFDPARRHSRERLVRMWEMRRVIDGDVLINRLSNGRVQTIEGDRIQTFGGIPFADLGIDDPSFVKNGVWVDDLGRAKGYMVFKRPPQWTGLIWDRMIRARFADLFGYYDRYDQVRGISPLASAANSLRDVYEGFDYALLKAKVSQFFAMTITRQMSDQLGELEKAEGETDPDADPDKPRYDVDMGRGGEVLLDMDPGDKAEVIESQQPSTQFQEFTKIMIMVALKALDIPFSFFDESHTNYSGARLAGVQFYEAAVKIKQHDLRLLLDKLTRWRVGMAVADGVEVPEGQPTIILPPGMKFADLKWEWVHSGVPLYDPLKEISGSVAAINAGLSSHDREGHKLGIDPYEMVDERARLEAYAKKKGVILSTALASTAMDDPANGKAITEDQTEEEQSDGKQKPQKGKPQSRFGQW